MNKVLAPHADSTRRLHPAIKLGGGMALMALAMSGCLDSSDRSAPSPLSTKVADKPSMRVRIEPPVQPLYVGESIRVAVSIVNDGPTAISVVKLPLALEIGRLSFELTGQRAGRVKRSGGWPWMEGPGPDDFDRIGPGKSCVREIDLWEDYHHRVWATDTCTLAVNVRIGEEEVRSTPVSFKIEELPQLDLRHQQRVDRHFAPTTPYQIDVGLIPQNDHRGLLVVVLKDANAEVAGKPSVMRTCRLAEVPTKSVIEAAILPDAPDQPPTKVHVLATAPDNSQRYFVLSPASHRVGLQLQSFPERKVRFEKPAEAGNVEVHINK
ncbi:MAG: hypothetical protein JNM56_13655 [Planctomycetia bacterium]|nr:hypothetical protein [Planctomycetia bacterium]